MTDPIVTPPAGDIPAAEPAPAPLPVDPAAVFDPSVAVGPGVAPETAAPASAIDHAGVASSTQPAAPEAPAEAPADEEEAEVSVSVQWRVFVRPDGSQYLVGPNVEGATHATEPEDEAHRMLPPSPTP
jgi:hypothetical protein